MKKYFVNKFDDVPTILWGEPEQVTEATMMIICPPLLPVEMVEKMCQLLSAEDPEGKHGEAMEKYVDMEMQNDALFFEEPDPTDLTTHVP